MPDDAFGAKQPRPGPGDDLVSVVIPARDATRTLGATLASVQNQTHRELEIIVIDDGSRDGTPDLVRRAAAEDPRIRLLTQSNAGVAAARNLGLADARGVFVAPVDADDLWHPRKVELQLAAFRKAPAAVGLVYAWSIHIDEQDFLVNGMNRSLEQGDVFARLLHCNFLGNASCPMVRRACLKEVGGYDPTLRARGGQGAEDLQFYLAVAERYDFAVVPALLVGYRQVGASMSRNVRQMRRSHRLVLEHWRRRHPQLPKPLFRWSLGLLECWLARRCLVEDADPLAYARLMGAALRHDPALLLEPEARRQMFWDVYGFARERARRLATPWRPAPAAPEPAPPRKSWDEFIAEPLELGQSLPRRMCSDRRSRLIDTYPRTMPAPRPHAAA